MADRIRYLRYWFWLRVMDVIARSFGRGRLWDFALGRAAACLRRKDWGDHG